MISYDQGYGLVKEDLRDDNFGYREKKIQGRTAAYEEGQWLYKRNSLYYLLYPAGGVPEHLAYSTSNSITGPWKYGDTIMHVIQSGGAFTNHPGLIDYKGNHYLFYHNGALPGGGGFKRSVCVEQFEFNVDGSIPLITPSKGVQKSLSNLNPYKRTEAETIAWAQGLKTVSDTGARLYVTNIDSGDYIKIRDVDFRQGARFFQAGVTSSFSGGSIEIRLDASDGRQIGSCSIPKALQNGKTIRCKTIKVKGVHDIYFIFQGRGANLFDFDWWLFKKLNALKSGSFDMFIMKKYILHSVFSPG